MILLNRVPLEVSNFPDHTQLIHVNVEKITSDLVPGAIQEITWNYENDAELFTLYCVARKIIACGLKVNLFMPYVPNARLDRCSCVDDVFTLRYFSEIINSIGFTNVRIFDPHSSVSYALINNVRVKSAAPFISDAISKIVHDMPEDGKLSIFYPDEGAMKRYSSTNFGYPYGFGVKRRNWQTGKIERLDLYMEEVEGRDILMVDDICSRGGTFYHSAVALKSAGANNIYIYCSHCENTIFQGVLLCSDLITKVFTTDSVFTGHHDKITVMEVR